LIKYSFFVRADFMNRSGIFHQTEMGNVAQTLLGLMDTGFFLSGNSSNVASGKCHFKTEL
jgi:hypothetical protein